MPTPNERMSVETDRQRQLLRMCFRGSVTAADVKSWTGDVDLMIGELRPGFTVVTDLTGLRDMDLDCVPELTRLMDHFAAAGAGRVVRVIPDPDKDIGFNLLSLTHYRGRIPITTCRTAGEAEETLKAGR